MRKVDAYREALRDLDDWDSYLAAASGLPGPRANLELAQAAADEGDETCFRHLLTFTPALGATNTPGEFLAFCGTVGLGRLLAEGRRDVLVELRQLASDPRWRVREAVAIALQRWGAADMPALLGAMEHWSRGAYLEQRAAAAALCEPALLHTESAARGALELLDRITEGLIAAADPRSDDFRVLRQALGYGWSVAAVALPSVGLPLMEKWLAHSDPNVRWIMRENLKKGRLQRLDAGWVARHHQESARRSDGNAGPG